MKLAEALSIRSDMKQRIHELENRLHRCMIVQVGDNPPEDPDELISAIDRSYSELQHLIEAIDLTNSQTFLEGRNLSSWLSQRNICLEHRNILLKIIEQAATGQRRVSRNEVRFISTIKVARLQKQADDMAKMFREIDLKLQSANWSVELLPAAGVETEKGVISPPGEDASE